MSFSSLTIACNSLGSSSVQLGFHSSSFTEALLSSSMRKKFAFRKCNVSCSASCDPLLVKAAKGHPVSRPPAWMMRQAGRYMAVYRKLAEKHPSFRERHTPLPAFGVPFDIEEVRGPVIQSQIRSEEGLKALHPIDLEKLKFVGDSLKILRKEIGDQAAVLGFIGAPWTIAKYIVEGGTTRTYTTIKSMCHTAPHVLKSLLSHLTKPISDYVIFQVESGAHCIQIFDSWGGQLPPHMWEQWSESYIKEIVSLVRSRCPRTPIVLYINGNGGFLERMKGTGVDVIGLDWTVDMADGRSRLGNDINVQGNVDPATLFSSGVDVIGLDWTVDMADGRSRLGNDINVQGNVDPATLFSSLPALTDEIKRVVKCAGPRGHILNLGHGVLVGTPEAAVAHFFEVAKSLKYDTSQNHAFGEPTLVV